MPGSPLSSTADPRANPSPTALSSSPMPETMRCTSRPLSARLSIVAAFALRLALRPTPPGAESALPSWDRLFQAPQEEHLPCHLLLAAPQTGKHSLGQASPLGVPLHSRPSHGRTRLGEFATSRERTRKQIGGGSAKPSNERGRGLRRDIRQRVSLVLYERLRHV